jgi:peptidoglycan/LPS O-acetylase OafA/YrhL
MTMYTSAYSVAAPPPPEPAPRPVPDPWRFRPEIEGLRAVAILLVVGADAGVAGLAGGHIGVDVFFVISGFLLTRGLLRQLEQQRRISLRRFYAARMLRLLPAVAVVVPVTLVAIWYWLPPAALRSFSLDALAAVLGFTNYRPAASPFQHFWAVSVTEQVALVWPVLLLLSSLIWLRGRAAWRLVAAAVAVLSVASFALSLWLGSGPALQSRLWEFGAGALLAAGVRRLVRTRVRFASFLVSSGVLVIVLAAVLGGPGGGTLSALWPVAGAALVLIGGCADPQHGLARLLAKAPVQELGRLSYGWYLWHWPMLFLAPYVLGRQPSQSLRIALAGGALLLASVSLVAVENRIRRRSAVRETPWPGLATGSGLVALAALAAVIGLYLPLPAVRPVVTAVSAPLAQLDKVRLRQLITAGSALTALPPGLTPSVAGAATDYPHDGDCLTPGDEPSISYGIGMGCERRGFKDGARIVVLFGDSHAQSWYDALNVVAQQRKWRLVVYAKSDCGAPDGEVTADGGECDRWRAEVFTRLAQLSPAMVIMSSLHHGLAPAGMTGDPDQAWAQGWLATVKQVKATGAKPVILEDNPFPRSNVLTCLTAHPRAVQDCDLRVPAAVNTGRQRAIRAMADANGVQVVDTTPWFCSATVCPAIVGGTPVYRDTNHITATYSAFLGPVLGKELIG